MRKANKIMMMTVSVLLCLVLFTSTALSGTLAKYSTSGESSTASARVAAWGVTVDAVVSNKLKAAVSNKSIDDNSLTIDLGEMEIAPGEDFSDAVYFKIQGKAEVALRVKIDVELSFNVDNGRANTFYIPPGIGGVTESTEQKYRFPIGFDFSPVYNGEATDPINANSPWRPAGQKLVSNTIHTILSRNIDVINDGINSAPTYAYKDFAPGEEIVFYKKVKTVVDNVTTYPIVEPKVSTNEFYLGFHWPMDIETQNLTKDQINEITMYYDSLPDAQTPKFVVRFTVSVEQIT